MTRAMSTVVAVLALLPALADGAPPPGFDALFNGKNLEGWTVPAGTVTSS